MIRARIGVLPLTLPLATVLSACASMAAGAAADPAQIGERVSGTGIAPDLVYVTELDGFDLMTQSVGVWGDDGMSVVYLAGDGRTVILTTARTPDPTAAPCADLAGSGEPLRCSVEHDGVQVFLEARGLDPATLSAAAEAVRVPSAGELDALFADLPSAPPAPVERGDLPSEGDGAPNNDVGVGG